MKTETSIDVYPWFATNEKLNVQIVRPRQVIMGNWLLCRSECGKEWFVPFPELQARKAPQRATALGRVINQERERE